MPEHYPIYCCWMPRTVWKKERHKKIPVCLHFFSFLLCIKVNITTADRIKMGENVNNIARAQAHQGVSLTLNLSFILFIFVKISPFVHLPFLLRLTFFYTLREWMECVTYVMKGGLNHFRGITLKLTPHHVKKHQ